MLRVVALLAALAVIADVALVVAGVLEPVMLVLGLLALIVFGLCMVFLRIGAGLDRLARLARELPERGIRRRGRVLDALPFTHQDTGAPVFQGGGAQMLLDVQLLTEDGAPDGRIRVHVVEPSDRSRSRVGKEVTVLVHPEDASMKALQGFRPNGQPL